MRERPTQPAPYPGDLPAARLTATGPLPVATTRPDQPAPYPGDTAPGGATWRRTWRDPLGRPMSGTVTLTGTARHDTGDLSVLPAPVTVALVDGSVDVTLPADTYRWQATLRTVDGQRTTDIGTVAL